MPPPFQSQVRDLIDTGLSAVTRGEIQAGADAFRRALALAPDDPQILKFLGTALLQLEQLDEAAGCLQRAAAKLRDDPSVLGNLAQALFALGAYDEAREAYRKASRLDPRAAHLQLGIATSLAMAGKFSDAELLLRKQTERFPQNAYVWHNLGNVLRDLQRPADAVDCYRKALTLDPNLIDARNNLGGVLRTLLQHEEAEREYRACLASAPDYLLAQCNLVSLLIDLGRFSEAEAECREIIRQAPELRIAHTYLGAALGHQQRHAEALACHRAAMALAPDDPAVIELYGSALTESGAFAEGLRCFARALALNPASTSGHQLLGNALLSHGRLTDGWAEYCYRPAYLEYHAGHTGQTIPHTLPPQLDGRQVHLLSEQGLGDELFFLRYAPLLKAAGVRISYRPGGKIRSLLQRAGCIDTLVEDNAPLPSAAATLMLGDLPHALCEAAQSMIPQPPIHDDTARARDYPQCVAVYWPPVPPSLVLPPLDTQLSALRLRLAAIGAPPYIGLTWHAGTPPQAQREKASWVLHKQVGIASLAASLRDIPGTYIALQRNPEAGQIEALAQALGRPVHDFTALNDDLEAMLALLSLIDEYIGVSNTNMHLRAAVGKMARVLMPCPAEWRWMAAGTSSPWFPGFRIYRQSPQGRSLSATCASTRAPASVGVTLTRAWPVRASGVKP